MHTGDFNAFVSCVMHTSTYPALGAMDNHNTHFLVNKGTGMTTFLKLYRKFYSLFIAIKMIMVSMFIFC